MWTRRCVEPHLKLLGKLEEYLIMLSGTNYMYMRLKKNMRLKKTRHILPRCSVDSDHFTRYSSIVEKEGLDWKIIVKELNSVKLLY